MNTCLPGLAVQEVEGALKGARLPAFDQVTQTDEASLARLISE